MGDIVGREPQLADLARVLALHSERNEAGVRVLEDPPSLVVVYGGASTGKSMCVAHALRQHAESFALVDCTGVYAAQEFYRDVLVQLYEQQQRQQLDAEEEGEDSHGLSITVDKDPEQQQQEEEEDDDDSEDDDSEEEDEEDKPQKQTNRTKAKEVDDAKEPAADSVVTYEGYNSLNFLGFVKALGIFMDSVATQQQDQPSRKQQQRVLYLALDHVDKFMDRGFTTLLTCICTLNDQLAYMNMFTDMEWDICVVFTTRAMSLEFDQLVSSFFPTFILFPSYTSDQIADILVHQLQMQAKARIFRKWVLQLYDLLPSSQDDWLEFRSAVVHILPDFQAFFRLVTDEAETSATAAVAAPTTPTKSSQSWKKLQTKTNMRVVELQKTRRKHLFGYDKLPRPISSASANGADPTELITCTDLSRSCLLLVIAGFLASFNPQDTDVNFLSSSGGIRQKRKRKKLTGSHSAATSSSQTSSEAPPISQLLIGPRIFKLQRLLAIYLNLRAEAMADITDPFASTEARDDIFIHLATLVRVQLFQRTSPPHALDDIKFRCLADFRFVQETAMHLRFPLETYLNASA